MKKLLLPLLFLASAARAQAPTEPPVSAPPAAWQGGMLFGHDLFRVTNQRPAFSVGQYRVVPRMTTPSTGFRIGLWVRHNFGPRRRWMVQPELAFSLNQSWHRITNTAQPNLTPTSTDFVSLSSAQEWQRLNLVVPVGFRLTRRLLVLGGPALSYRMPTAYERSQPDYNRRIVGSINSSMRRAGLAWQVGAGYELGRVLLTARYERSALSVARSIELDGQRYPFRHFASQVSLGAALRVAPMR